MIRTTRGNKLFLNSLIVGDRVQNVMGTNWKVVPVTQDDKKDKNPQELYVLQDEKNPAKRLVLWEDPQDGDPFDLLSHTKIPAFRKCLDVEPRRCD
jgi:hypothetical protein